MNRDTLYSSAVFDVGESPAVITLPDAGGRYMAIQIIDEDHYTRLVAHDPGPYTLDQAVTGTRYTAVLVRLFVDPLDPADVAAANALQDAIRVEQERPGSFTVPAWDTTSLDRVRDALKQLGRAQGGFGTGEMFGLPEEVEPVSHLIGSAAGWGGNPRHEAMYEAVVPARNDGNTVHRLTVRDVPVDGFWSISVYNSDGFFERNALDRYTVNNVTAERSDDGSVTIQFGGCEGRSPNCLPVMPGWNYLVRLYRPRPEVLSSAWRFPTAEAVP